MSKNSIKAFKYDTHLPFNQIRRVSGIFTSGIWPIGPPMVICHYLQYDPKLQGNQGRNALDDYSFSNLFFRL